MRETLPETFACQLHTEDLFGYESEQAGDGVDVDYLVWTIDRRPACGRLRVPYDSLGDEPRWTLYLNVPDCAAALADIVRAPAHGLPGRRVTVRAAAGQSSCS
ncbi:hypothetical protein Ssi03_44790 [Sphaerisporangium siamense]|uniref:Uncharacterized protein n=1 Tax=Sphaerisporangium siamense TaxID=795645 RepID=A0A7W7DEF4_9ACTN|nr:hypothetical protein [Sphaerisporangium siamense]MBB4705359.1 hypothetical protein [Sphaerisporangium siamense]GII86489.1 hypothetical protein Ssi03_44790 [Sphaerisporangium siamense]